MLGNRTLTRLNTPLARAFHRFFAPWCDLSLYFAVTGVEEKQWAKTVDGDHN
jgi:hypothetical protein